MSDPSVPWLVAGYAVAVVLIGGYALWLWRARIRVNKWKQKS